jgi:hypothetical protein
VVGVGVTAGVVDGVAVKVVVVVGVGVTDNAAHDVSALIIPIIYPVCS